jgi:hypothetical protein
MIDPEERQQWTNGGCFVLALEIHRQTRLPLYAACYGAGPECEVGGECFDSLPDHVYAMTEDGTRVHVDYGLPSAEPLAEIEATVAQVMAWALQIDEPPDPVETQRVARELVRGLA